MWLFDLSPKKRAWMKQVWWLQQKVHPAHGPWATDTGPPHGVRASPHGRLGVFGTAQHGLNEPLQLLGSPCACGENDAGNSRWASGNA